jgi:hypothetical protein
MKHIPKSGTKVKISEMSDQHLKNTINLIYKRAKSGMTIAVISGSPYNDDYFYDEEIIFGEDVFERMNFSEYYREALRRGLF